MLMGTIMTSLDAMKTVVGWHDGRIKKRAKKGAFSRSFFVTTTVPTDDGVPRLQTYHNIANQDADNAVANLVQ